MSDEDAKKRWGQERRARRREWSDVEEKEFDKRHTRKAKFKMIPFVARFTPDGMAAMEVRRAGLNYGRGMSRSEYLEFLVRRDTSSGRAAKEYREKWAKEHDPDPGAP
jgi:hypothetical protein